MKYIVFITENKVENRILVGFHKTDKEFDGYLGDSVNMYETSSFMYPKTAFQCAVKKYGVKSFKRMTLFESEDREKSLNYYKNIVTEEFVESELNYNVGTPKYDTIYQFNLDGELVKTWKHIEDLCDFYCYPYYMFEMVIDSKEKLLNSYFATTDSIDVNEYVNRCPKFYYLYTKEGKLYKPIFPKSNKKVIVSVVNNQTLVRGKYYLQDKLTDLFIPKPRRQFKNKIFYVYKEGEFIGSYKGKEVMKVIDNHSWRKISNAININNGWYKNFFISTKEIDKIPEKPTKRLISVYDDRGNFIEEADILTLKNKYEMTNKNIRDFQRGNKYFNNYILKYSK